MRRAIRFQAAVPLVLLLTAAGANLRAGPITYVLQPGSTFTPCYGASPTGPAEALTGSFTWQLTSNYYFQCTALSFQSASFTFSLDTNYGNVSTVDSSNSTIFFNTVIDVTSLWAPAVSTFSGWQAFQGPPDSPTHLDFEGMGLGPAPNGGAWAGRMTLIADPQSPTFNPGDANGDGVVDILDLNKLLTNFDKSGMNWSQGDFDGNGVVDILDLNKVLTNFDKTFKASAALQAVPEPSSLLLLTSAVGLLAWRRRK